MIGHDDLDLLAVRYVTGELAAAETTAFEARLADDQAARDAVEFAVRIAVVSADDMSPHSPNHRSENGPVRSTIHKP